MDLFIGWSGERSRLVGQALYSWLPNVVQAVSPWMSENDIEAGAQWANELMDRLKTAKFAIICVTADNREHTWIHFEAGLVAKAMTTNRVVPVLLDLNLADVHGPLAIFQMKRLKNRNEMLQLMQTISRNLENPLREELLLAAFEKFWPELEQQLADVPAAATALEKRDAIEVAEETLLAVREQGRLLSDLASQMSIQRTLSMFRASNPTGDYQVRHLFPQRSRGKTEQLFQEYLEQYRKLTEDADKSIPLNIDGGNEQSTDQGPRQKPQ